MLSYLPVIALLWAPTLATIPSLPNYHVVWSDDFDGDHYAGVDPSKWVQIAKSNNANGEVETYTSGTDNVHLSGDGQLYIVPTKSDGKWYSGRLESNTNQVCDVGGAMIFQSELWVPDFTGNPAKFAGLWPAFWAKGNNYRSSGVPWPRCGEWDIFEVTDKMSNQNQGTLHFQDANGNNNGAFNGRVTYQGGQYHTWAFKVDLRNSDWTKQSLIWYEQWVQLAQSPYYILLNVAVGGGYPGNPTQSTVSGYDASMRVKYVAIYKTD